MTSKNGKGEGVRVKELTPDEAHRLLDEQAQRYLGMPADEFIRKWSAGELDPEQPEVMRVAMLLPQAA